ncbi:MAG: hypothetical protein LBU32_19950 [Clostridiales bacterium]|jgi:hypothetical protein|nr:hypothetical protein [Clostridiales bacterium]
MAKNLARDKEINNSRELIRIILVYFPELFERIEELEELRNLRYNAYGKKKVVL